MKRILLLFGVVLSLIFSTPFTMIGAVAIAAADNVSEYSTVQEDLDAFGITEEDYILDPESNEQISCLMFAETTSSKNDYFYYLYLYNPGGFYKSHATTYKKIELGYLSANTSSYLEEGNIAINWYDLTYLSLSDNATVAKYLVKDFNPSTKKPYRRYQVRQISSNISLPGIVLGDEYFYQTNSDGSVSYQYRKFNYITLENPVAASISIENTTLLEQLLPFVENKDNQTCYFYGFSIPDKYMVEQLIEVDIFYTYYYWDYWSYSLTGELYYDTEWTDSSPYWPYWSEQKNNTVTIDEEHKSFEGQERFLFFSESYTLDWQTISTPKELIDGTKHEDFKNFINNHFKESEYVINYLNEEFTFTTRGISGDLFSSDWDRNFQDWLLKKNDTIVGYNIHTNKVDMVEMVRMKFNSQGEIYDLSVIVNPVISQNPDDMDPNPNWWEKLLELFKKYVAWIQETFDVSEGLAWVIAIVSIFIGGSIVVGLIFGLIKAGIIELIKLLFEGILAIILFPFNLLFGKKKENNNHNNFYRRE